MLRYKATGKRCAAIVCLIRKYNRGNRSNEHNKKQENRKYNKGNRSNEHNKKQEKGACSYFDSTFAFGYFCILTFAVYLQLNFCSYFDSTFDVGFGSNEQLWSDFYYFNRKIKHLATQASFGPR